jgi:hypothetical protein
LLLFPGYAKPAIHPYSGQGSDAEIAFMQGVLDFRDRHALQIGRLYEILANGVGGFLVWWTDTMSRLLLPIPNPRTHPQSGGYQDDWFLTMYHSFVEQSMQEGHRTHVPH